MTTRAAFSGLSSDRISRILILLLIAVYMPSVFAQQRAQISPEPVDISRGGLEESRKKIKDNKSLNDQIREEIVGRYDEALNAISVAEKYSSLAASYEHDQSIVPRLMESLEAQLQSEPPVQAVSISNSATAADVEQMMQQAGAELASRREAVQAVKQLTSQRNNRLTEIGRRAAALDQQIFDLDSSIESAMETISEPLLKNATLANLAARRLAAREEIRALSAERINIRLRSPLRLLMEQRAERRVLEALRRMNSLEEILRLKVSAEIEGNLARVRKESADALSRHPNLKILTNEIMQLAEQLFGPEGVEKRSEPMTSRLNALREVRAKAARAIEVSESKYQALGSGAELQRWYPVLPPEVPSRNELQTQITELSLSLANAKAMLVELQDKRANKPDLDTELAALLTSLKPAADSSDRMEQRSLCRHLLITRTELLDRLVSRYTAYYSKLTELDKTSQELLRELEQGYQFALDRVYWRRSINGPLIPSAKSVADAARWLFLSREWPASISRSLQNLYENLGIFIPGLLLLILLWVGRKHLKQRLTQVGKLANESPKPLRPLLESILITFFLAAPVPLVMVGIGIFLRSPQSADVAEKVGIALIRSSLLTFGLEVILQIFRTGGLAEIQLQLNTERCRRIYHEVRSLIWVVVPSVLLFMSFGSETKDHTGDPSQIAHLQSLGRIAFIVAISAVALTSLRLSKWLARLGRGMSIRLPSIVLAVLGFASLLAALLSIFGWHLSAFVLAMLLLRSFFLILNVALVALIIERLRQIRERLLRESESRKLGEQASEAEEEIEAARLSDEKIDVESTNRQVAELIRLGSVVVTILGFYFIWSAQIPSLRFLERVQLLPSAQILPMEQIAPVDADRPGRPVPATADAAATAEPIQTASSQDRVEQSQAAYSLTLAGLLGAIGILFLLAVLAKYLPSLLDFAVLSRFRIVSGDRNAITTIVRYILVLVGLSAVAAKLGLRWSQVQWLAAAFSFGLGFGLQDIFANFFSGLVLLFERPMRVGDFCRFGAQLGTVESIGLRSTKVRGLDRTVINVPNADFSKKELVNYAKRDRMLLRTTIGLRYETSDEQLRYVLAKIRELLLSHPRIMEDPARVRFVGYGEYTLDIEIFAYGIAADWAEFLAVQEDVLLRIKRIVEESGTGFAFPSQTTYLSRDQGLDEERTAASEAEVQVWRSEQKLPFPEFSERQRRLFRDSLDYPPTGSPFAGAPIDQKEAKKTDDDPKE